MSNQPFCDIEVQPVALLPEQYDDLIREFKKRANRDLKFSDSQFDITALELHYVSYFNKVVGAQLGYNSGYRLGHRHGIFIGMFIMALILIGIVSFFKYL